MSALRRQILDHLEQMTDRARQPIKPYNNKRVASANLPKQFGESRAGTRGPGSVFLDDHIAPRRSQVDFLGFRRLLVRRDECIADQPALWSTGSPVLGVCSHL